MAAIKCTNLDVANGQFMRGGYLLRFKNVKCLLCYVIRTYKMWFGDKVMQIYEFLWL